MTNFNLPPGTCSGDPLAPWNRVDPWVGRTCGECRYCRTFYPTKDATSADGHACIIDVALGDVCGCQMGDKACEGFEV